MAQNKPEIDAHRFAAVLAGFDICNSSDEETVAAAKVSDSMATTSGVRNGLVERTPSDDS